MCLKTIHACTCLDSLFGTNMYAYTQAYTHTRASRRPMYTYVSNMDTHKQNTCTHRHTESIDHAIVRVCVWHTYSGCTQVHTCCLWANTGICMYIYTYIYTYIYIFLCMYVCMYIRIYTCSFSWTYCKKTSQQSDPLCSNSFLQTIPKLLLSKAVYIYIYIYIYIWLPRVMYVVKICTLICKDEEKKLVAISFRAKTKKICMYVKIHTYIYIHIYIYIYIYIYTYIYICAYDMYICVHTHRRMHVCMLVLNDKFLHYCMSFAHIQATQYVCVPKTHVYPNAQTHTLPFQTCTQTYCNT